MVEAIAEILVLGRPQKEHHLDLFGFVESLAEGQDKHAGKAVSPCRKVWKASSSWADA